MLEDRKRAAALTRNAVAFHPAPEGSGRNTQFTGSLATMTFVLLERSLNRHCLRVRESF